MGGTDPVLIPTKVCLQGTSGMNKHVPQLRAVNVLNKYHRWVQMRKEGSTVWAGVGTGT